MCTSLCISHYVHRQTTADKHVTHARAMLGWIHKFQGVPVEELTLHSLFPSADKGVACVGLSLSRSIRPIPHTNVVWLTVRCGLADCEMVKHLSSAVQ